MTRGLGPQGLLLSWLLSCALGTLLGVSLLAVCFALAVGLLGAMSALGPALTSALFSADPVYTRAAFGTLTDVHLHGLAVAGPLGSLLRSWSPALFANPVAAHELLGRLTVAPGSALLAQDAAATLSFACVAGIGFALLRAGLRHPRTPLAIMGAAIQAQVVAAVLGQPPTMSDLEATGLSFAINVVLPWLTGRRIALSDLVATTPAPIVAAAMSGIALAVVGLIGLALCRAGLWAAEAVRRPIRARHDTDPQPMKADEPVTSESWLHLAGLGSLASAAAALMLNATLIGWTPGAAAAAARASTSPADLVGDRWYADYHPGTGFSETPLTAWTPRRVEIQQSSPDSYHFKYLVDGVPKTLRGMGLNTQYAQIYSPDDRAARLDSDFTEMRRLGVNTVLGWDEREFDTTLLDAAQEHDLGVVVPLTLDPTADYTDPGVRARLTAEIHDRVLEYRNHPALRMWGLGNEVLHKIVHPSWLGGSQDPASVANARAFSTWLVETADMIHELDPFHPVTYRDAEDAYTSWVTDALNAEGGGASRASWFLYGTNAYTVQIQKVLANWPAQKMGVALWVSEFAPAGVSPADRPSGFRTMWSDIRAQPNWVLGGAVYAWTRDGPEEIDRALGLTDDGTPADSKSLSTISALFNASSHYATTGVGSSDGS